jgi:hypothetical protein
VNKTTVEWRPAGVVTRISSSRPSTSWKQRNPASTTSFLLQDAITTARFQAPSTKRAGFEFAKLVIGAQESPTMASTTISQAPLISQRLNATGKLLQDATIDERYVWSGEMRRVGLKLEFAGSRLTWKRLRSGKRTNRTRGLRLTCVSF